MIQHSVSITPEGLAGDMAVPDNPLGFIIFAHGSGSSRHSPRNRYVAGVLQKGGFGTLLLDLLTPDEEALDRATGHLRFDIGLLADRLVRATDWVTSTETEFPGSAEVRKLPLGYFGASTGAAAALVAAAQRPSVIKAVVSRGGRPDLAEAALRKVKAPTLLIVGGRDHVVIELNRAAFAELECEKKIRIVPGATHLFEEPGTLEQVAVLARDWFADHLKATG